jgi:hypothetical protein
MIDLVISSCIYLDLGWRVSVLRPWFEVGRERLVVREIITSQVVFMMVEDDGSLPRYLPTMSSREVATVDELLRWMGCYGG